jgi:beta-1,4-mannosyltransferase
MGGRWLLHIQPLLYLAVVVGGVLFGLSLATDIVSNTNLKEPEWWTTLLRSLNIICIIHVLSAFFGFLLPHRKLENCIEKLRADNDGELPNLYIRYVTRGDNPSVITESVKKAFEMTKDYENVWVEVATDNPVVMTPEIMELNYSNLIELVVPEDYKTENKSVFKARALQYALENSQIGHNDFILHLDEESHLTEEALIGIYQHIYKNPDKVGQGPITYFRSLPVGLDRLKPSNWKRTFCTMADAIRVSDDLSRFRLAFNIGSPIFGCKGSYIVIKNSIERDVPFDLPPKLCITEDASFAFSLHQKKYKFAYVEGFISEISPSTFSDFIKQRARWMRGLWLIVFKHEGNWVRRIVITFGMVTWSLIFLNIVAFASFFALSDYRLPTSIAVINGIIFATYVFSYMYGGLIGGYGIITSFIGIWLTPLFLLLETVSCVYAFFTMDACNFHVIKK